MKKLLAILACIPLLFCACKSPNLAPGGHYNPAVTNLVTVTNGTNVISVPRVEATGQADVKLFAADASFRMAYTLLDNAFAFEQTNRAMLWAISPEIKHGLDKIRPEAAKATVAYYRGRAAYVAAPSPAGLTGLQSVITTVQQLGVTVTAIVSSIYTATPAK
jgi:hypothetical protein